MLSRTLCQLISVGVILALTHSWALGAPSCKGQNKNEPGCPGAIEPTPTPTPTPTPAPILPGAPVVHSTTVDWANEKIILRGSGLDAVTTFTLGGSALVDIGAVSPTEVELRFDDIMAGEVTGAGSYSLKADGVDVISIYAIASVVSRTAAGCPCEPDWSAGLGALWGADPNQTACYTVTGPGVADLAGTVLTDPSDPTLYPQYPIGASYYATDPVSSSCRLVQINDSDPFQQEVVNIRINADQQIACAEAMQTSVCATTEPSLVP